MRTKAQKWGNSVAIRVPKGIVEKAGIEIGCEFDIDVDDDKIVLLPRRRSGYRLADLVEQITVENLHGEVDFGEPVGREDPER